MNPYRRRIFEQLRTLLEPRGPLGTALDFGSGDGWFAQELQQQKLVERVTAVDVHRRPRVLVEPTMYDGHTLPFADRSFDLGYAVDVLHHAPDPLEALGELLRCTRRYLLLKDHTSSTALGWWLLAALDEIGNRRFNVRCRYRYQRNWDWLPVIEQHGFVLERLIHPSPVHVGLLGKVTNGLQFIGIWKRTDFPTD
jgi:SAM-dependent methyltransferase